MRHEYESHCDMAESCAVYEGKDRLDHYDYRDDPDTVNRLKLGQLEVEIYRVPAHLSCKQLEDNMSRNFKLFNGFSGAVLLWTHQSLPNALMNCLSCTHWLNFPSMMNDPG